MHLFKLVAFVCVGALGIAWAIPMATYSYADFVTSLKAIDPDVIKLDDAINAFKDSIIQAYNVYVAAEAVHGANTEAIHALDPLQRLNNAQAHETLGIIQNGVPNVEKMLHDLSEKQSLFARLHLDDKIRSGLIQLRTRVQQVRNKVLEKIPSALQAEATKVYARIDIAISAAITAYSS